MTFANVLGCDLWSSTMHDEDFQGFELNPIQAFGSNTWQTACGWTAFAYQAVAWKDGCTSDDAIFDDCLQVDGDADPTAAEPAHSPLLPTNLRFGTPGSGDYRDRLAAP